jgi:hypothetical protein
MPVLLFHRADFFYSSKNQIAVPALFGTIRRTMMKKIELPKGIFLAGMLCISIASAAFEPITDVFVSPINPAARVTFESRVTELLSGQGYEYSYRIVSIDYTNASLTLLSIPFTVPLTYPDEIFDFQPQFTEPTSRYWSIIDNPAVAAHAFFAPFPLTGGGSETFSFKSSYGPAAVHGYVNDARLGSLFGDLYAPVPEPATIVFLFLGLGGIVHKTKKS